MPGFGFGYGYFNNLPLLGNRVAVPTDFANLLSWHSALDHADMTLVTVDRSDFTAWTVSNSTRNASQEAPPGFTANTGYTLIEDTANTTHGITIASPSAQSGDVEFDVYAKALGAGNQRWICINLGTTTGTLVVNLTDGTAQQGSNCFAYSVVDAGSGWWRIRAIFARTSGTDARIYIQNANQTSVNTYVGDGVSGIRVYIGACRQRKISQLNDKSGNNYHLTQSADASRPFALTHPMLGFKTVCGTSNSTKSFTDNAAIATALSGTGKAFTATYLMRTASSATQDMLKLTGATASHQILGHTAAHGYAMTRTNDATTVTTPTFASSDFTQDRNWHAVSVVFDGTNAELWIDGQKSSTTFGLGSGACTYTALTETVSARQWVERTIYSRALNTTERAALELGMIFRAGLPVPSLENPLNVPGIQAWWETDTGLTLSSASLTTTVLSSWTANGGSFADLGGGVYRFTESGATSSHYASTTSVNSTPGPAIVTVDLKQFPGGRQWAIVQSGATYAYYDLVNGVVGSGVAGAIPTIQTLGDGWYRCTMTGGATTTTVALYSVPTDGGLSYASDGRTNFDAKNITFTQQRISAWVDKTFAAWSLTQATVSSQPFYANGAYISSGQIGGFGIHAPNSQKSLNSTTLGAILNGADRPLSMVSLAQIDLANVALASPYFWQNNSTTAYHYGGSRNTTGGQWGIARKDDTSATASQTYGSVTTGVQTIAEVFTGTQSSFFVNGSQLGATQTLDVGTITANNFGLQFIAQSTRGFVLANRAITDAERTALENGFKRRAGLI